MFFQLGAEQQNSYNLFLQFVNDYNQSQDSIELRLDSTTASCSFDAADTLLARIAKGNPPDIMGSPYSVLWDHLLDLTPYLKNYDLSQMDTTSFQKFRTSNGLMYLPLGYRTDLLFYNKDMFDRACVPYPPHNYDSLYADGDVWDVNKLQEVSMLLTVDRNDHNANHLEFDPDHIAQYGFHWTYNNGVGFLEMFGSPQIVNPNGITTIPQHMRDGYHWSHEGIWQRHFIPSQQVFVDTMQADPLGSGRTAMVLCGSWYGDMIRDTSIHWDIAAIPSYHGTQHVCWGEGGYGILNTTQHPAEALAVIMAIANTIDFYIMDGPAIPKMNNLRTQVLERWRTRYPHIDRQVILDGLNYRNPLTSAEAIRYNMSAWRILNSVRDYIWSDPNAQIDGCIDTWLIPQLENIFKPTDVKNSMLNDVPSQFRLNQNYPNPFNPTTVINYQLPVTSQVSLRVYDMLGREVATLVNDVKPAGVYTIQWDAKNFPSGVYFYQLRSGNSLNTKKLILIK
jgi:ABC-type glycerol-3-phosphate transport system substrate-binding protein